MQAGERFAADLARRLEGLKAEGLYKSERVIASRQGGEVRLADGREEINLCANNYLGLAGDPEIVAAAHEALERYGFGMASVRFICGTQEEHKALEARIAAFLGMEDAILYAAAFDANAGLFEALLGPEDAVISDALNHASIIDGIRLRYANSDMEDLERCLREAQDARHRLIATDGVFSMDGYFARLERICDLAERYDAMVMVDDCHATGFVGKTGRGTPEHCGVTGRIDILTGTLGKALGGASVGGLYGSLGGGGGLAPAALAALSLFQHAGAGDRGGIAQGLRPAGGARSEPAGAAVGECRPFPQANGRTRFRVVAGRACHCSGDAARSEVGAGHGGAA